MSDQSKEQGVSEEALEPGAEPAAADDIGGDYEVVVKLIKENEELKDRALRVAAEMENLRRRTARDVHDARAYAIANFARDMLSVSDNLRRALDAVPEEAKTSGDAGFKALFEGVDITERAMLTALERHGVKKLNPEGEKFDPNFHQAMFEVPNADVPANRSCRSCSRAIRSASGCCARPWSASPRAAPSMPPAKHRSSRGLSMNRPRRMLSRGVRQ